VRSHYQRRDLEILFKLQPRAAQKLIELMPRSSVGAALLVERDHLATFLQSVRDSDNPTKLLAEIRKNPPPVTRKKMRTLLQYESRSGTTLPDSIHLRRCRLEVSFRTAEELAEAMLAIAKIIETDEFAQSYTYLKRPSSDAEESRRELRAMFDELEQMEALSGHQTDTIVGIAP
jgi:hypothetical protein